MFLALVMFVMRVMLVMRVMRVALVAMMFSHNNINLDFNNIRILIPVVD
jgi:hypothetical protein